MSGLTLAHFKEIRTMFREANRVDHLEFLITARQKAELEALDLMTHNTFKWCLKQMNSVNTSPNNRGLNTISVK